MFLSSLSFDSLSICVFCRFLLFVEYLCVKSDLVLDPCNSDQSQDLRQAESRLCSDYSRLWLHISNTVDLVDFLSALINVMHHHCDETRPVTCFCQRCCFLSICSARTYFGSVCLRLVLTELSGSGTVFHRYAFNP